MGRFDRYLLSQLLLVFGLFALILVGVYWVNRAVILVDRFMGAGQSGFMVLELTIFSLPSIIQLVMPIAAFLAVIYTCNRLHSDSELVVVQATGFSGFRMARPVLGFGLLIAAIMLVLSHVLVPLSMIQLNTKEDALRDAASSRLLVPGAFEHPTRGITVYVRDTSSDGEMYYLLISDRRDPNRETTYTAQRALLVRDPEGPKLLMFDGIAQTLDQQTGQLATTEYTDFTYDIGGFVAERRPRALDGRQLSTFALLQASEENQNRTRRSAAWLVREAHLRNAESILVPAICVMGFAALMLGGFSRFGLWRQITLAVTLVVIVKLVDNAAADLARRSADVWFLVYMPSALAAVIALVLLWLGGRRFSVPWARTKGEGGNA
ncbi:MAG: LPS export ABC transporter permease LptF [Pseudomonadota bacterium]